MFRRNLLLTFAFIFTVLIVSLCWLLFTSPPKTKWPKIIVIKKGMNLKKVSALLENEGIIRSERFFVAIATLLGKKAEIKAGEYEFPGPVLPMEALDVLVKGQAKRHLVTIVEGYTLSQIAQLLEELGIVEKEAFLRKATSADFIVSLGLPDSSAAGSMSTIEGYLFPDTYHLYKEMAPEEAIQMMVNQFKKIFGPDLGSRAHELGISPKEAVILASIIEKETPLPEEKPLVSAVFHNRLKRRIPLQSDPTVIYGISNFDGNLTKKHLLTPTAYNTYLFPGLPPTPICNPGKDSILAALCPAPVSYLYFVSKNDGSHYFSAHIEEHEQAVWKYQKNFRKK